MQKLSRWLFIFTVAASFLLTLKVCFIEGDRGHYSGDGASNDAAFDGGHCFDKLGFLALRFVPVQKPNCEAVPEIPANPRSTAFYFHYPAGPDLTQGILFRLGFRTRLSHQLFAVLVSAIGLWFAWLALNRLFSAWPAQIAWSFLALSPSFIFFSDNLHQNATLFTLKWVFLNELTKLYGRLREGGAVSPPYLWRSFFKFFAIGLVGSWFSLDLVPQMLILGLFCFGVVPLLPWTNAFLLASAGVIGEILGFALHVLKNGLVLGGPLAAVNDFLAIFLVRTGHGQAAIASETYSLQKHVVKMILGEQWFFTLPCLLLALTGWIYKLKSQPPSKKEEENEKENEKEKTENLAIWLSLFTAAVIGMFFWPFFMKQHSMVHAFTYRHAETFAVLGVGLFIEKARRKRIWGVAIIAYMTLHTIACVFSLEGTSLKQAFIDRLVPEQDRVSWGCQQRTRLSNSTELPGAKMIASQMSGPLENCNACREFPYGAPSAMEKIRERLAEIVLYWR